MKKGIVLFLFLSLFLRGETFAVSKSPTVSPTLTVSPTVTVSPTPAPIVYELPYPGILPDHPLYPLKALRDRVIRFLINDPLKKAEFSLLNADKRLNAGIFLIQKKKYSLAASTISKSNNYMHDAISNVRKAKELDKNASSLVSKIRLSLTKHQQLLSDLEKGADSSYAKELSSEGKRLVEFEKLLE